MATKDSKDEATGTELLEDIEALRLGVRHGICVAKMLDKTSSIICAFSLAAAAPRSPYRHLELCGIALTFSTRRCR